MRDYRLKKIGDYITKVTSDRLEDGTEVLNVEFADGRVFKNILHNKENMQKLIERQEAQAEDGIANLPTLKNHLKYQGVLAGGTAILGGITGYEIGRIQELLCQNDAPIILPLSIGLLTITGLVIGLGPLIKSKIVIGEIEKVKFREDNRHDLRAYIYYPNSLAGVNKKTKDILIDAKEKKLDPFYTINVDDFTKKDFEKIIDNVNTERKYQFTYPEKVYRKDK